MRTRSTIVLVLVALLLLPATAALARGGPKPKVDVCHIPPGNPGEAHTIRISGNALAAHLGHGDTEGPCPVERPGRDGDDDDDDANRAPIARAGDDRCVLYGGSVPLNGSASSDPDGDALDHEWDVISRPAGSSLVDGNLAPSDDVATPTFVPDRLGTYRFELEVTDPDGASDTDQVAIAVRMSVGLNAQSYVVDEGETTPVTITLHTAAPQPVPVAISIDADEAVVVEAPTDGVGDAVSSVVIPTGSTSRVVYLLGVEDAGDADERTFLVVTVGTGTCEGEASAAVDVLDDDDVSGFLPWHRWILREDAVALMV